MKKVFCGKCKHYVSGTEDDRCIAPDNMVDTYRMERDRSDRKPCELNQYNNCKMFVEDLGF